MSHVGILVTPIAAAFVAMSAFTASADARVWLDELSLEEMSCGWNSPNKNKSVAGNAIKIGSKTFERGVGTHATSLAIYEVDGKAIAFDADVGLDAEVFPGGTESASVKFSVMADARVVATTEVLRGKGESVHLHADLSGAKIVELLVSDADNGDTWEHADWADA